MVCLDMFRIIVMISLMRYKDIVKLKVDYIKHNTTVAFPTILFVKNEIDEIPYKITSKNNPDVVEGCIKVKS